MIKDTIKFSEKIQKYISDKLNALLEFKTSKVEKIKVALVAIKDIFKK